MNYRHVFHAGNFADIAKHVALHVCLDALKRKDSAFFVLDTHAGRGSYDMQSAEATKSGEAERGIQKLIQANPDEAVVRAYINAVGGRKGKRLARYPGSPGLISAALRAQDRALFVEILPAEARAIEREVATPGRLRTEIGDGYAALKAFLPPEERRGLVLIDPPYESVDELKEMVRAFVEAYRRWPTGIYLMWYPIRSAAQRNLVHGRFEALRIPKMLYADLAVHPDDATAGLAGSGMLIVNPPFGADDALLSAYRAIHAAIAAPDSGYVDVGRLSPERMAQ